MHFLRYLIVIATISFTSVSFSATIPDDVEPGDSIHDIPLPLTQSTAAELIKIEFKGKILSVSEENNNDQTLFTIKVLHNDGMIKFYQLDANTGYPPR